MEHLKDYNWPGNVRELQNYIGRTLVNIKYHEREIFKRHLPKFFDHDRELIATESDFSKDESISIKRGKSLKMVLQEKEKEVIELTLREMGGNRRETANVLGLSLRNLYYKIDQYDIH